MRDSATEAVSGGAPSLARNARSIASALSPKSLGLRCVEDGLSARREEGAYLNRYATDEQRSRWPIFNATHWAGAGWLFFRLLACPVSIQILALRSRLEKQPTDLRRNQRDLVRRRYTSATETVNTDCPSPLRHSIP
jgi:hypothetical protein